MGAEAAATGGAWVADDADVGSEIYDDGRMFWRVQNMETDEKIYCWSPEMGARIAKALTALDRIERRMADISDIDKGYGSVYDALDDMIDEGGAGDGQ